jgi:hypothetical protein
MYVYGMRAAGVLLLCITALLAQSAKQDPWWAALAFLTGEWTGEGGGGPGQGSGEFSFRPDLDGAILIRKNVAHYPATKDKPAYSHTDLMIVDSTRRANYFDNEGHTIHYAVEPSPDGNRVQFLSDASASQPRYRLTYRKIGADRVAIQFEIAPPGKDFATYIEATARRKKR